MNRIDELRCRIDAELEALDSTLGEYEQTLADVDETLSENKLEKTESVQRYAETKTASTGAD